MGDLLFKSRQGMASQKRLIGGSDLWKIKKSPPDCSEDGGFFIHTTNWKVRSYFASPNAAWASLAACSIWASSMMTAILISEVEII